VTEPHAPAAPPPRDAGAPPPAPRSPLSRWFEPVKVPLEAPGELRTLAARSSLVFVMRSPSLLAYLYLRWFLRRHGLPPLRASQGLRGALAWLASVRSSRRAFEEALAAGDSSVVFLGRRDAHDPFSAMVRTQRDLFQPLLLVPVLLVWSRRAQKLKPSIWDILYGSPEAPSAFANAIAFIRNVNRAFFGVGRPVDLKMVIAELGTEPDAVLARKVRGVLHQHLAREFRTAVGPPLKAPSRVREKVLRDRGLRATIEAVAKERGKEPASVVREAEKDLREIASLYDPRVIQILRGILGWIFRRLYTSIEVDEEGLARVKRAAAGAPIVLCPSHKSYIDFLVLPVVLFDHGMTPPHVAAGINLAFWPFDKLARRGGAFFIRRKVKGDRVYTAVLRAYVKHLLRDRFPQKFYIEGGRSRTGKLLFPKTGLVSMEVDAWLEGAADDVVFVPIAIDYEKLIEATSYARELAGGEKEKESLRGLLGAVRVLARRYERVYVQFEEPISLRQVAEARLGQSAGLLAVDDAWSGETFRAAAPDVDGRKDTPAEAKRRLVQTLANRIAYGISRAVTITPVGLVAAALLSHTRRGISAPEVARRIELLRYIAAEGGARVARGCGGAPSDPLAPGPIADAVRRLEAGGVVRVSVAAGDTIYQVPDEKRPVLDYHRNAVIHRYVPPALVAAAARAAGADAPVAEVRERALWLSRLLKLEFMYRVGATFDEIFDQNLAFLVRVRALALSPEDDRVRPGADAATLGFLAELVRPYLEAYRLAAVTALDALPAQPGDTVDRKALLAASMEHGLAAFLAGAIAVRESVSKAPLENALEWLVSQGLLGEENGGVTLRDREAVRGIVDQIGRCLQA
jgi:glycerol-3-phosphate O-acyltransferase